MAVLLLCPVVAGRAGEPPTTPFFEIESGSHSNSITKIAVDADNRHLVTASTDRTLRVWSLPDLKPVRTIRPPMGSKLDGRLLAVAISPDDTLIAAGGQTGYEWDGTFCVYLFERESGRMLRRIAGLPAPVLHLAFSPDGRYLMIALAKEGIRLVETVTWTLVGSDADYGARATWIDFDHRGRLAAVSEDAVVRLYEILPQGSERLKLLTSQLAPAGGKPATIAFSPDGAMLAIGYELPCRVDILSASDLSLLATPYEANSAKNLMELQAVAWTLDGKSLYAGGRRGVAGEKLIVRWPIRGDALPATSGVKVGGNGRKRNLQGFYTMTVPFTNRIQQFLPLKGGKVLFATGDPGIGILDDDNRLLRSVPAAIPVYTLIADAFRISGNGDAIQFGYEKYGNSRTIFSFLERGLKDVGEADAETLRKPLTVGSLNITNWKNQQNPMLNGEPLEIAGKYARSLAIAPDNNSFLLGVDGQVYRFDREGNQIWRKALPSTAWGLNISGDGRLFTVAIGDGTIRWYRMDTAVEQLAFFPHPDRRRWIAWCPEGYFDASPGAEELIGFHLNAGSAQEAAFIPMNNLYDVFYRPDIIQAKLRGDDIGPLVTLTPEEALRNPPPKARFTTVPPKSADAKSKVCYRIESSGGGIGEVRLFQNGKLIKSDGFYREVALKEKDDRVRIAGLSSRAIYQEMRSLAVSRKDDVTSLAAKPKGQTFEECVEVEPTPGENEIGVAAFNAPNTVQGFMATASFTSTRKAEEPHLYILAVGIDSYRDSGINLKYAAKDARDFMQRLPKRAASLFMPENIHLVSLVDSQAGKEGILAAIAKLSQTVKQGDSFIFFTASHGVLLQNQYYIVTADFDGDLTSTKALISSNEIVEMSKRIKSLSQLYIFDTCHAGGIDAIISGLYDARMSVMAKKMGLHIFASAGSVQAALDGYQGNGLYTHTLLAGIANGKEVDREQEGSVTVKKLGRYSREKTTEISNRLGHPQTPVIIDFGRDNPLFAVH
jgi:WD40 repeat protein